jgi:hypothetical protein
LKTGYITNRFEKNNKLWLIGAFQPNIFQTDKFEFGIHKHKKGEVGENHAHPLTIEINFILKGLLKVKNKVIGADGYFIFDKGEESGNVKFLEDSTIFVFRTGSYPTKDKIVIKKKK